jgi:hypothetical protein
VRVADRTGAGGDTGRPGLGANTFTSPLFENLPAGVGVAKIGAVADNEPMAFYEGKIKDGRHHPQSRTLDDAKRLSGQDRTENWNPLRCIAGGDTGRMAF